MKQDQWFSNILCSASKKCQGIPEFVPLQIAHYVASFIQSLWMFILRSLVGLYMFCLFISKWMVPKSKSLSLCRDVYFINTKYNECSKTSKAHLHLDPWRTTGPLDKAWPATPPLRQANPPPATTASGGPTLAGGLQMSKTDTIDATSTP